MQILNRTLLLSIVALLVIAWLRAHVPVYYAPGPAGVAWPAGSNITYLLNNQIGPGMPNLQAGSTPVAAIDAAMSRVGAASGLVFQNGGMTAAANPGTGSAQLLVTFAPTPSNLALLAGLTGYVIVGFNTSNGQIYGFDIIGSPTASWATNGAPGWVDMESMIVHEALHGVGLDHSPLFDSSMYPTTFTGTTKQRTLTQDDLAGVHSIYGGGNPSAGTVTGTLQRSPAAPVAGGHVFLHDVITGRTAGGALSLPNGSFSIPGVSPGLYQLHAQPLDGPMVPSELLGAFWLPIAFDTTFRPAQLGGTANPTTLVVKNGQTVNAGSFMVAGPASTLDITQVFFNSTPTPAGAVSSLEQAAPYSAHMGVFGTGVHLPTAASFSLPGPFMSITGPGIWGSSNPGFDDRILPISVSAQAPAGAYLMRVLDSSTGELAVFPGCLEILPGTASKAYAAPYGTSCPGSLGPLTLGANGVPALGNFAFSVTVSGTVPGSTAYFVLSLLPDFLQVGSGCVVSVDVGSLLLPLPGLGVPAGASATLALPLANSPAFGGVEVYLQVLSLDALAPNGFALSNALKLHIE